MSIKGDIIDNVKTALEAITTGNGYNQTVAGVSTSKMKVPDELHADDFPYIFVVDDREPKNAGDVDSVMCDLSLIIDGYVKKANDQDDVQAKRRNLENDIEKALMVDESRGGLAIKTQVRDIVTDKGTMEPFSITELTVDIRYYHNRNDPSNQDNSPTP